MQMTHSVCCCLADRTPTLSECPDAKTPSFRQGHEFTVSDLEKRATLVFLGAIVNVFLKLPLSSRRNICRMLVSQGPILKIFLAQYKEGLWLNTQKIRPYQQN